jgi:uncharacterized protein involved in exopolysaccharide biosynthesis
MAEETTGLKQATTRDFLAVVFRQLWVIVTVFMISVVSVLVVSWRSPTTYESSSRVLVKRGQKWSVLQPNLSVLPWEEEVNSEIETVKSFPVAQRSQKILDEWFKQGKLTKPIRVSPSGVNAGVIGESNVIEISYTNRDPQTCVPVTNALTQAYMEFRREAMTVPFVNEFFTREIAAVDSAMREVQARREVYFKTTGTIAPPEERHELFNLLQNLENELASVQQEIRVNNQSLRHAERNIAENDVPNLAYFSSLGLGNGTTLNVLQQRLNELEQQRENLVAKQTPKHPELHGVTLALDEVRKQIRDEAQSTVELMRARAHTLEERERTLTGQAASTRAQLERIPDKEISLSELDHETTTLRDRYKELVGKEIQARISQATSPDLTVTLFAPASRPKALKTTDYVRLALAPILSLVVGLMLAFFLDSLDHSIKTATDVEEYLGIPVLASLPEYRSS